MHGSPTVDERDRIASDYFASLLYPPYPVQEEALLACTPVNRGFGLRADGDGKKR